MAQQTNHIGDTNKMVTAVEWLYHKLSTCTSEEMVGNINNWFKQAKEMEKEQIIKAWNDHKYNKWGNENTVVDGEDFYNETYKNK